MLRNVRRRIEGTPVNEMPQAGGRDARRRRAIAIAAKINQKYPYATFGRAYVRRGSAESLDQFGTTYRQASDIQKQNRKRYGYIGRGLYSSRALRNDYETLMGKRVSRAISGKLASSIRNLPIPFSGSGLYTNNLIAGGTGSIPSVMGSGDETGAITVSHTEYICDVFGPGVAGGSAVSFENQSFPLNPGMEQTFPWLSQIAQNFEEYEFKQLIFSYTSTITDIGNSTNGQCGTLTMATDYNAAHQPFSDKQEMLSYAHSYSCKTTEPMDHGVECDPNKNALSKVLYVRSENLVSTEDIKTYDHGIFQLAISNSPTALNGQSLGELRVSYTVTLRKPKLFTARGLAIQRDRFISNSGVGSQLITPTSVVYRGQRNGLNCVIRPTTRGSTNGFDVVFPDTYTGAVQIMVTARSLATVTGGQFFIQPPLVFGNVTTLNEIYSSEGTPTFMLTTTINDGVSAGADACLIFHCFVRASTGGNDNVVFIWGTQNTTSSFQTFVNISEYNSYDKTRNTEIDNWISPTGVVVAGNATL